MYKGLLKKIGFVGIADFFVRLKAFVFIPIISKTLGVRSYGVWTQIMVTVTMILPIVLMGMQFGFLRFLPGKSKEKTRDDVSSIMSLVTIASFAGAIALISMSNFLSKKFFGSQEFSYSLKLGGVFLVTMALRELLLSYFRAKEKISFYSILVSSEAILSILLLLLLIYVGYGVNMILFALIFLNILLIIVSFIAVYRDVGFVFPSFISIRTYFAYSLPFLPLIWLLWIMNSSDRYFLGYFRTLKEVGIYSACYGISYFVVNMVTGSIYLVFQPVVIRMWNSSNREFAAILINNLIKYALFFVIPSAFIFLIVSKSLIPIFTTPDFTAGVIIIPFVLLSYIFFTTTMFVEIIVYLKNDTKRLLFIYSVTALCNIIFNAVLVPAIGILGAAISTVCSFALQLLLMIFIVWKDKILKIDAVFLIKNIIATLIMGVTIIGIPQNSLLHVVLIVGCGAVTYTGAAFLLRTFTKAEIETIKLALCDLKPKIIF